MSFAEFGFSETAFAGNNVSGGFEVITTNFVIPFDVLEDIRRDYVVRHTIANGFEQNFIINYELQGAVIVDFNIPFAVIARTEHDIIIKHEIIGGLSADFLINHEITNDIFQDFILNWDVTPRVDAIVVYNKIGLRRSSRSISIKG